MADTIRTGLKVNRPRKAPQLDVLVTRHLTLRPPLEVDADSLTQIMQNKNITRMLTRVPNPYGVDDAKDWITERQSKNDELCFTIHRQKLIGVVSVENKDRGLELGYWLDEPHWGNGYMTEAARAVLSHAFKKFDGDEIVSGAYADNPASRRVLDKLGFEFDGQREQFCKTRGTGVATDLASLSRARFEALFGTGETTAAA